MPHADLPTTATTLQSSQMSSNEGQGNHHRPSGRARQRGRSRGRGGSGEVLSNDARPGLNSVESSAMEHNTPQQTDDRRAKPHSTRGRGRGRGRGQAGIVQSTRTVGGRQFGGRLTQDNTSVPNVHSATSFQPTAAVFVPSSLAPPSSTLPPSVAKTKPRKSVAPRERLPKSQAPDIATRTHEDIENGHYECPICTSEVERKSKVWSCNLCWTVFHLSCIKKWSANEGSAANSNQPQNDEFPPARQWRCPGCNLPKDELPKQYTCWCSKEIEPRAPAGIPPHSCGQSCLRSRPGKCPHAHTDICHAGPCPPCTEMGPTKPCFCGRHQLTKPCTQTDYEHGWSCQEVCCATMPCGEHLCQRECHEGSCGPCTVRMPARCCCGKVEKDIQCHDRGKYSSSELVHVQDDGGTITEAWTGTFSCSNVCDRLFDCGKHHCSRSCHPLDPTPAHCQLSPDVVTHCPCGKTSLTQLSQEPRTSCTDAIPNCDKPCGKSLPCGHDCPEPCHSALQCPPCWERIDIKCRCGRVTSRTLCHQGTIEPPQCMRICRTTLNCGRHACDEHCCPGERKAVERQSTKKKHRPLGSVLLPFEDMMESEHICTRMCNRLLSCGNHRDESLCHKGPCGSCREAIFDEVSCHCGRTVIQPPLPCGTPPPPCRYPCLRGKNCGHPQVPHNCHQDDESCPKCPFLVEKRCMCGKKTLKNQQCWLVDVRCGEICGRLLKCGSHRCRKPCHPSGECEDFDEPCQQRCGKSKPLCGHPDEAPCHSVFACKQEQPCPNKIFITCECQAQKQETKCGVSKTSTGNSTKVLPCTDECARLERNRRLALALNIDQSSHVDGGDHIPYATDTLNIFALHTRWAQEQEREFRVFATSDNERRLRFKPMKSLQRQFIHLLADDYGLDSESMDPEPNRHVMIWKTPRFVSPPNKTLAEALRIRQLTRGSTLSSANVSDTEGSSRKAKASNEVGAPYNAFVITNPRFGLTVDELRVELTTVTPPTAAFNFEIEFLPSEEVVLRAVTRTLEAHDLQTALRALKGPLVANISGKGYGAMQLCAADPSLNIIRRESDADSAHGGWSRVAAKKAATRDVLLTNAGGSTHNPFAALSGGSKLTFAKKKIPQRPRPGTAAPPVVVDDWEAAEAAEEEKDETRVDVERHSPERSGSPIDD